MSSEPNASSGASPSTQHERASFFRHGGWLMFTAMAGGVFSLGVHFLSKRVDPSGEGDWGTFVALLSILNFIPALPLQMVFAQQTAAALATGRERQVPGMVRLALISTTLLCIAGAVVLIFVQHHLVAQWELASAAPLWMTWCAVLFTFWWPVLFGVMQGQQNFLWFGWGMILNGLGRVVCAGLIVFLVTNSVGGLMGGVALALLGMVALGAWQTARIWKGDDEPYDRSTFLKQVVPVTLGFAASQFLFSGDVILARSWLEKDEASIYGVAGTMARALVWFVTPLTAVMFPKIVHSTARREKTNLMGLTLACTALLALIGAVALCIVSPFMVKLVFTPEYAGATALIPWYAAAMIPFCVANVLVNNLLARSDSRPVIFMVLLAITYGVTLSLMRGSPVMILQLVGAFNVGLLALCAWFTWGVKVPERK